MLRAALDADLRARDVYFGILLEDLKVKGTC